MPTINPETRIENLCAWSERARADFRCLASAPHTPKARYSGFGLSFGSSFLGAAAGRGAGFSAGGGVAGLRASGFGGGWCSAGAGGLAVRSGAFGAGFG